MNSCADLSALHRRLARPMVTGDQQDEAFTRLFRTFESQVDRSPRAIETMPVKIDDAVRLEGA